MLVLLVGMMLALLPAHPSASTAPDRAPARDAAPVFGAVAVVAGHRMATVSVGYDTLAFVLDRHMYARTFSDQVGELDVVLSAPDDQEQPSNSFALRFGRGRVDYSIDIASPRAATGFVATTAKLSRID